MSEKNRFVAEAKGLVIKNKPKGAKTELKRALEAAKKRDLYNRSRNER